MGVRAAFGRTGFQENEYQVTWIFAATWTEKHFEPIKICFLCHMQKTPKNNAFG